MRYFKIISGLLLSATFFLSCGETKVVNVEIAVAQNTSPDLKQSISEAMQAGTSRGVFFKFDPIKFCPQSIDDVDTTQASLQHPSVNTLGVDPTRSSFEVDTSILSPEKIYRIQILAFDNNNPPMVTHRGTVNCPLSIKYPTLNRLVVCLGDINNNPLCSGAGTSYPTLFNTNPAMDCSLTPEQSAQCN